MLAGQGRFGSDKLRWCSLEDHPAAVVTRTRAHVEDPVGADHHGLVLLDHDHGLAGVDESAEQVQELLDIGEMQSGRRLVEDIGLDEGGVGLVDQLLRLGGDGAEFQ